MDLQHATAVAYLNVADRDRALAFYCEKLGLALRSSDAFGDFVDLGGGLLRVTVMPDHKPSPHPVLGWNVEAIEAAVAALADKGVASRSTRAWARTRSASGPRRTARRRSPSSPIPRAMCCPCRRPEDVRGRGEEKEGAGDGPKCGRVLVKAPGHHHLGSSSFGRTIWPRRLKACLADLSPDLDLHAAYWARLIRECHDPCA